MVQGCSFFFVYEWNNFLQDIVFKLHVALDSSGGMVPVAVKTFVIDGIQTEELQVPGVDLWSNGFHKT